MVKTFKNLLWNQKADDLETMWHWFLRFYQVCSNDDLGLTLTYLTGRSNLIPFVFVLENAEAVDFRETIEACEVKVCIYSQMNWVCDNLWQPKVRVIHWPLSNVSQIQHFQTSFPVKILQHLKLNCEWSHRGMSGWKFVQMFQVTRPRWLPGSYVLKTLKNALYRTKRLITLKLGIQHRALKYFLFGTGLTLTIFMTWSDLFPNAFAWVKAYTAYDIVMYTFQAWPNS